MHFAGTKNKQKIKMQTVHSNTITCIVCYPLPVQPYTVYRGLDEFRIPEAIVLSFAESLSIRTWYSGSLGNFSKDQIALHLFYEKNHPYLLYTWNVIKTAQINVSRMDTEYINHWHWCTIFQKDQIALHLFYEKTSIFVVHMKCC